MNDDVGVWMATHLYADVILRGKTFTPQYTRMHTAA
jgi:hypothetical protein